MVSAERQNKDEGSPPGGELLEFIADRTIIGEGAIALSR